MNGKAVIEAGCSFDGRQLKGNEGDLFQVSCPPGCDKRDTTWGTGVYSGNSPVCRSGIHAGAIPSTGGTVTVKLEAGRPAYRGSIRVARAPLMGGPEESFEVASRIAALSGLSCMTMTDLLPAAATTIHSADTRGAALRLRVLSTQLLGVRTTYVDEGTGPVVLLLHGAPMTSLGFVRVIRELSGTHRVVAPDLPGFGGSEVPDGVKGSLDEYARFVVEFVNALGLLNVVMYVNDSSGCVGIAAASRFSPGILRGMVVASTVPIPLTGAAWFVGLLLRFVITSRVMRWCNRRLNLLPWMVATVAPWLRPFTKAERAVLTREFDTAEKRERVLDLFEQMAVDRAFMLSAAQRASNRLANVPILILYGQFDPMRIVGGVSCFRTMFPRNEVVIVPFEEHFPILSSGAQVARAMRDWMSRLPAIAHG